MNQLLCAVVIGGLQIGSLHSDEEGHRTLEESDGSTPRSEQAGVAASGNGGYRPEAGSDEEAKKGPWALEPDPSLPDVLILGDSISIGYTLSVRRLLEGKANVFRPCSATGDKPVNCQGTTHGVGRLDRWLAGREWDVIHFNWGLHDLKHVDPESRKNSDSFDDPRQAEPDVYEAQLRRIVDKLEETGAELVFATTTPYPAGVSPARLPEDAKLYNGIARKVMSEKGIRVNDLHALVEDRLADWQRPRNVHFKREGSEAMAAQVAATIGRALVAGDDGKDVIE